eukprot:7707622-Alexandrium_andersonii.AAC.1
MFRLIEGGEPWPEALSHARVVFLHKAGAGVVPGDFRLLSIASVVYRRWAAARLKDMHTWIASWLPESMHGGFPGRAADSAAYLLAAELEGAKMAGEHKSALSIDVCK